MMTTKKTYMVPETAFEQFLKPMCIMQGTFGSGGNDPVDTSDKYAPKRKPF